MVAITIQVATKGPLFTQGGAPLEAALQRSVQALVELGEQRLDQMLRPRPGGVYLSFAQAGRKASKGNYRRNVAGKVSHLHGLITDGKVVYGPWLEGESSRNAVTRFKGYHSFRQVGQHVEKQMPTVVQREVVKAVAEYNR